MTVFSVGAAISTVARVENHEDISLCFFDRAHQLLIGEPDWGL